MGAHLGWKMLWKGGAGRLGQLFFCLLQCKPVVFQLRVNSWARPSKRNGSPWKSTSEPLKNVWASLWNPPMEKGVIATCQYLQLDPIYYYQLFINHGLAYLLLKSNFHWKPNIKNGLHGRLANSNTHMDVLKRSIWWVYHMNILRESIWVLERQI